MVHSFWTSIEFLYIVYPNPRMIEIYLVTKDYTQQCCLSANNLYPFTESKSLVDASLLFTVEIPVMTRYYTQ